MPLQEQLKRDISILPEHVLEMFSLIVQDYKKMNTASVVPSKQERLSDLWGSCDDETFVAPEDIEGVYACVESADRGLVVIDNQIAVTN